MGFLEKVRICEKMKNEVIRGALNKQAIDRELRMIELKKEVNNLLKQAGLVEKYIIPA